MVRAGVVGGISTGMPNAYRWPGAGFDSVDEGFREMQIRLFGFGLLKTAFILGLLSLAAVGGYQYGTAATKEKCGKALELAIVDQALRESTEARHDRALVELMNQQRVDEAFRRSQARYFSRVLLLSELEKSSENPVMQRDIKAELFDAKALSIKTSFVFDNERDSTAWEALLKALPEPKKNSPAGKLPERHATSGIPTKTQ